MSSACFSDGTKRKCPQSRTERNSGNIISEKFQSIPYTSPEACVLSCRNIHDEQKKYSSRLIEPSCLRCQRGHAAGPAALSDQRLRLQLQRSSQPHAGLFQPFLHHSTAFRLSVRPHLKTMVHPRGNSSRGTGHVIRRLSAVILGHLCRRCAQRHGGSALSPRRSTLCQQGFRQCPGDRVEHFFRRRKYRICARTDAGRGARACLWPARHIGSGACCREHGVPAVHPDCPHAPGKP